VRKSALFLLGLVVTALVTLGLVVLSSASESNAMRLYNDAYYFIKRQFVYLAAAIVLAVAVAVFDYRKWRDYQFLSWMFYVGVIILLIAVFGGRPINGSYRWLSVGPLRLQPSEFAKLATVIVISVWMDRSAWRVELFKRGALWPAALIGIMAAPILFEPDFGSVMVVSLVGFTVMFVAGTRFVHMLPFFSVGAAVFIFKVVTNANRMARFAAFFGGGGDAEVKVLDKAAANAAHQAHQALVAIHNADIWGVGLNQSMQKHYYLPEAHTDFIFAIGAEELGIIFSASVLLLFIAFFALSVYIARKASDRLGRFLVVGMMFIVFFQAMFNIGVVCEALPTKGMALPFFSYGGTNLLSTFFAVGTIFSVGIHSYRDRKRALLRNVIMKGR
jgi:cell division protein FtsW